MKKLTDLITCPNCNLNAEIRRGFSVVLDPPVHFDSSRLVAHRNSKQKLEMDTINGRRGLPIVVCLRCDRQILLYPLALIEE